MVHMGLLGSDPAESALTGPETWELGLGVKGYMSYSLNSLKRVIWGII